MSERLMDYRAWLIGAAGLAVLLARQAGDSGNGWRSLVLYGVGAALFGLAVERTRRVESRTSWPESHRWPNDTKRLLIAVCVLIVLTYVSLDIVNISGTVWTLQAIAAAVLVGAAYLADGDHRRAHVAPAPPSMPFEAPRAVALGVLAAIMLLGAWVRFRQLGTWPAGFWWDEADLALHGRRMSEDGARPLFAGAVPAYFSYLIAIVTSVFGESMATVRAVSAIGGTLTIPAAYLVGRELFGRSAGLVAAFIFAFSRWAITLSRVGMNNVFVPLCALVALGFALRGHRRSSHVDYSIAGMAAASGMLFYPAMSATIVAIALIMGAITFASGRPFRSLATKAAFVILGGLIVFTPLAKVALTDGDTYFGRTRETALWSDRGLSDQDSVPDALAHNLGEYLTMTHWQGDPNGRHNIPGKPLLSPLVAGLAVLGVGAAVMRRDRWVLFILLAWFPLGYLPGVLSLPFEAPNSLRAVTILPLAVIAATAAFVAVARTFASNERVQIGILAAVGVGLALTGVHEVRDYFHAQQHRSDVWAVHSTYETITANEVAAASPDEHVAAVAFLRHSRQHEFLNRERSFDQIFGTDQALPMYVPNGKDAIYFTTDEAYDIGAQARQIYPEVEVQTSFGPHPLDLIAVRVPAESVDASRGWSQAIANDGAPVATTTVVTDLQGDYRFRLVGPGELLVNGFGLAGCGNQGGFPLAAGQHRITVFGHREGSDPIVEWIGPGISDWRPIPGDRLYRGAIGAGGLLVTYFDGETGGDLIRARLHEMAPTIDVRLHEFALPRPYTMQWTAGLRADRPGDYRLVLTSDDETRVELGGSEVLSLGPDGGGIETVVSLDPDVIEPITVTYVDRDGRSELQLAWVPPGNTDLVPIPASALVPEFAPRSGCSP